MLPISSIIQEELRVGDTRLASEEDLDGLSVAEVQNLISLRVRIL